MKFAKMHGCGNDYVYVDCTEEELRNPEKVAVAVSDRHFGIGSDGLILIKKSEVADFKMEMYNADGSLGEMCGNGIRCVAKYVYDKGMTNKQSIKVETLAGIKTLELVLVDGKVALVRVDMGEPILAAKDIPVTCGKEQMIDEPLEVRGEEYHATCVSMGNPHCVIFMEQDVRGLDLVPMGPGFEYHERFPRRINTEFVNVLDKTHLRMRVWERGSGETLACGTGACAVAVAAHINGLTGTLVDIELAGGHLEIVYDEKRNHVMLTGPAEMVFEGEWDETCVR